MNIEERLTALRERARANLADCILPFWTSDAILDRENGGFYGRITKDMEPDNSQPRSLVLAGRMAYAFFTGYMLLGDPVCLERGRTLYDYLIAAFYDREHGGAFQSVDCRGAPVDRGKSLYSEAFFVMACAACYHATRDEEALRIAWETFDLIEAKAREGPAVYRNNLARDWSPAQAPAGRRSFPADIVMFPHHLCQAYEQLYRATGDKRAKAVLGEMAAHMARVLYDRENRCFCTLFDRDGKRYGTHQSYGHDCELSYLAMDVALLWGDRDLIRSVRHVCESVLYQVLEHGFDSRHSLYNGVDLSTGAHDESHVWWAQAEALTAMLFGYQLTGDEAFLTACERQLDYIERYFVDQEHGDWYNNILVDDAGRHIVDGMHGFDKLNGGKCPFHNTHACCELIRRTGELLAAPHQAPGGQHE